MSEPAPAAGSDRDGKPSSAARSGRTRGNDIKRLLLAAEKGDAGSQFNLAVLYGNCVDDNGHVGAGNRAEAVKWLRRAAELELPRAQHKLAELYAKGSDAPENRIRAYAWFRRAMAVSVGTHRQAAEAGVERVAALMTPIQIATAERLLRRWRHRAMNAA